jgi:hypothetical protein
MAMLEVWNNRTCIISHYRPFFKLLDSVSVGSKCRGYKPKRICENKSKQWDKGNLTKAITAALENKMSVV